MFGRDVTVHARDRRSTSAWDLGAAFWYPEPEGRLGVPIFALYFWRRPDEEQFFRGTFSVLYNDLVYAHALAPESPFEVVLGFENNTTPTESTERVDGERIEDEQLLWGSVRGAVGLGYPRQIAPGFGGLTILEDVNPQAPDNMLSVSLTAEPKYLYFGGGHNANFRWVEPQDTVELQGHAAMRWDALERNLLDLSHAGYALGADGTYGWRANWEDWGVAASHRAESGRHPRLLQGYAVVAGGVPGAGERHRLIGTAYGGWGANLDRFSAPRLGGGPGGDEFFSLARPRLPGASISEFTPEHYAVAIAEYRYELFFFTYLGARASLGWLDRDRLSFDDDSEGPFRREDDVMSSLGARITTGFFFRTRLQLDYNYGFDVIRDGHRGGNEVVVHFSGSF